MINVLVDIIIALLVAGFIVWAVRKVLPLIPIDATFKAVIEVILVIVVAAVVLFYVVIPLLHILASNVHIPTIGH
jgi:hypothetical protein